MVYLPSIEWDYIPRDFALLAFRFKSKLTPWSTGAYDTPFALGSSDSSGKSLFILQTSR
jgi:hypothetical protein